VRRFLLATLVVAIGLSPGAASARTINGTPRADRLTGTEAADSVFGRGGGDVLDGRGGGDVLSGGPGDDRIAAEQDRARDTVRCGPGRDVVTAELTDRVAADCEVVSRQLSRDPYTAPDSQHEAEVEPDSFSYGSGIVVAFQAGRFDDGGASNIGFATSANGGGTWRSGFLPAITRVSRPPGRFDRASDPSVTYDAIHRVWLVASLDASDEELSIVVSRSRNGVTWSAPVTVAADQEEDYDKEWIACDNGGASRFRGHCYVSYEDAARDVIVTRRSLDGGLTWSAGVVTSPAAPARGIVNGAQPVVRPNGTLVVVWATFGTFSEGDRATELVDAGDERANQIAAARSADGGASFGGATRISELESTDVPGIRAPPLPSADVDASGRVYVAWSDCRFQDECTSNDIVLATSRDGATWTPPARVPFTDVRPEVDHFVPGLAADPRSGEIAVAAYSLPRPDGCNALVACPGVDVSIVTSANGGGEWSRTQRLDSRAMSPWSMPTAGIGRMLGDYISTSYVGGRPVPVFALASPAQGDDLRQAIFATTVLPR
jgi:hypothetical protein